MLPPVNYLVVVSCGLSSVCDSSSWLVLNPVWIMPLMMLNLYVMEAKFYHMGPSFPLFQIYKIFLPVSQVLLRVLVIPAVIVTSLKLNIMLF